MPCYQRQVMALDWANVDLPILEAALLKLGLTNRQGSTFTSAHTGKQVTVATLACVGYVKGEFVGVAYRDGRLTVTARDAAALERQVRRAYGEQTLRTAAKRFGWNVQQTSEQQFVVRRRS
ncbi:MAG: hypothetical protein KGJ86_00080 [Chloroflexota bacterium]|nr:hypothetical protein [Chloroflexota bacterium]